MGTVEVELSALGDVAADRAAEGLADAFGIDLDRARAIVERVPVVVKSAATETEAQPYVDALRSLGLKVRIVRGEASPAPTSACTMCRAAVTEDATCPRCGWDKRSGRRCIHCRGAVFPLAGESPPTLLLWLTGLAMVCAAVAFGVLGPMLVGFAACAALSIRTGLRIAPRCTDCDRVASTTFFSEGERTEISSRRTTQFLAAAGAVALVPIVAGAWFFIVSAPTRSGRFMFGGNLTWVVIAGYFALAQMMRATWRNATGGGGVT